MSIPPTSGGQKAQDQVTSRSHVWQSPSWFVVDHFLVVSSYDGEQRIKFSLFLIQVPTPITRTEPPCKKHLPKSLTQHYHVGDLNFNTLVLQSSL